MNKVHVGDSGSYAIIARDRSSRLYGIERHAHSAATDSVDMNRYVVAEVRLNVRGEVCFRNHRLPKVLVMGVDVGCEQKGSMTLGYAVRC